MKPSVPNEIAMTQSRDEKSARIAATALDAALDTARAAPPVRRKPRLGDRPEDDPVVREAMERDRARVRHAKAFHEAEQTLRSAPAASRKAFVAPKSFAVGTAVMAGVAVASPVAAAALAVGGMVVGTFAMAKATSPSVSEGASMTLGLLAGTSVVAITTALSPPLGMAVILGSLAVATRALFVEAKEKEEEIRKDVAHAREVLGLAPRLDPASWKAFRNKGHPVVVPATPPRFKSS